MTGSGYEIVRARNTVCFSASGVLTSGSGAPAFTTTPNNELATGVRVPASSVPRCSSVAAASAVITTTSARSPAPIFASRPPVVALENLQRVPRLVREVLAELLERVGHRARDEYRELRSAGRGAETEPQQRHERQVGFAHVALSAAARTPRRRRPAARWSPCRARGRCGPSCLARRRPSPTARRCTARRRPRTRSARR